MTAKFTQRDWLVWFNERVAILQYDAGLSRVEAERQAQAMLLEAKAEVARDQEMAI